MANLSSKQGQGQRRHGRPTMLLLSMLLLVLLTEQVQGQRAIASLGSKIKGFGRKKSSPSSNGNGNGYIVQGEPEDKESFFQKTEMLVAGLVLCTTILLSFWNTLFNKKEGELYISCCVYRLINEIVGVHALYLYYVCCCLILE
jgi:hypothetical protein